MPDKPTLLWTLQAAWCFLSLTIITGLVALRGESASHFKAAKDAVSKNFVEMLERGDAIEVGLFTVDVPWYCRAGQFLFPWCFAISFVLTAIFAILNVGKIAP